MKPNGFKKSLYVFLTSLLGILMFVILQRSAALIGLMLLSLDYGRFNLGTTYSQAHLINLATYVLAVFLGGWYGVWLGLYWYRVVYEEGQGGLFHGFIGKFFDHQEPVAKIKPATSFKLGTLPTPARSVDGVGNNKSWEFDDLVHRKVTPKKQARPRIATKEVEPQVAITATPADTPLKLQKVRKAASQKKKTSAPKRKMARVKSRTLAEKAEAV